MKWGQSWEFKNDIIHSPYAKIVVFREAATLNQLGSLLRHS
jgi:hypothetical protein